MRVLIVDDNPEARRELAELLAAGGHTVAEVPSAARAVRRLERAEFDLLFADLAAGRRSGLELLAETRERWPRLLVVMLTENATAEAAARSLKLGAFDYLAKPIRADRVRRVLELVGRRLALNRAGAEPLDPVRYARKLAAEGGFEVLLVSPFPLAVTTRRVHPSPLDTDRPSRIRDAVAEFVAARKRPAVVIAPIDALFARHREEEVAALLEEIRALLDGKGPVAIGYDPARIGAVGAFTVRASIVSAGAHSTLESLANPIRRLVLRRLADGPSTFMQAMSAAHLEDTSKLAFHLRKLRESDLVARGARERYELTERGRGAVEILDAIDLLETGRAGGNRVFSTAENGTAAVPPRSRPRP